MKVLLWMANLAILAPYLGLLVTSWFGAGPGGPGSAIAFVGAALVWSHRPRDGTARPGRFPAVGLGGLVVATCGMLLSVYSDFRVGVSLCAVGIVVVQLYLHRGWAAVRSAWLAIAMLLVASPLPGIVVIALTPRLLELATGSAEFLLRAACEVVTREGFRLHLENGTVVVVQDCSGLDGVLLLIPVAMLLLHADRSASLVRVGVVIPLAIGFGLLANLFRIVGTGLLLEAGPSWAGSDGLHEVLGVIALLLAVLGLRWVVRRTRGRRAS